MKKNELKEIAQRHNMEILRNPVTRETWGLMVNVPSEISELDAIVDASSTVVCGLREYCPWDGSITYKITCPTGWFDLWGWTD